MSLKTSLFLVLSALIISTSAWSQQLPSEAPDGTALSEQLTDLRERLPKLIAQAQKEATEAKRANAAREVLAAAGAADSQVQLLASRPAPSHIAASDSSMDIRQAGGLVDTIAQAIVALVGLVLTAIVGVVVPKAVSAFERYVGMKFDDKQLQAIYNSANTAKGILETKIDQGVIKLADISENSLAVRNETAAALDRVQGAVDFHKVTEDQMAKIIVARVDTGLKPESVVLNLQTPIVNDPALAGHS